MCRMDAKRSECTRTVASFIWKLNIKFMIIVCCVYKCVYKIKFVFASKVLWKQKQNRWLTYIIIYEYRMIWHCHVETEVKVNGVICLIMIARVTRIAFLTNSSSSRQMHRIYACMNTKNIINSYWHSIR